MFNLISTIISGAIIGWIASMFMNESGGFWKYCVTGVFGSAIARFLCNFIGLSQSGLLGLASNILGACIFIVLVRKLK